MTRGVWKGPFVHPSLLKKIDKLKDQTKKNADKNLVKKLYNNTRVCWS